MSETFALGSFGDRRTPYTGLVVDDQVVALAPFLPGTLLDLLDDWDRNFDALVELAGRVRRDGTAAHGAVPLAGLRVGPPIRRPGKMLHSAANYREHVKEMTAYNVAAGNVDPAARFTGDKSVARPYLFLKASSALTGAFDDIIVPDGDHQMDWEAELAVVIGRTGRRIAVDRALDHVAGYMATNDMTLRDTLWRADRPNFKTDWLSSKSPDGFAPMGPLFVPKAFIGNPGDLRITLKVNGVTKQDGNTSEMIFSAEEQIAFASSFMTLDPGDVFVTGTVGGVGQATGEFLYAGDIVETEVVGVGKLRNRLVAGA